MACTIPYNYVPNLDIRPLLEFKPSCIVYHGENPRTIAQRTWKLKSIEVKPSEELCKNLMEQTK